MLGQMSFSPTVRAPEVCDPGPSNAERMYDEFKLPWVFTDGGVRLAECEDGEGHGAYVWKRKKSKASGEKRMRVVQNSDAEMARRLRVKREQYVADCRATAKSMFTKWTNMLDDRDRRASAGDASAYSEASYASNSDEEYDDDFGTCEKPRQKRSNPQTQTFKAASSSSNPCKFSVPGAVVHTRVRPSSGRPDVTIVLPNGMKFRSYASAQRWFDQHGVEDDQT